jgi:hypothetical protein
MREKREAVLPQAQLSLSYHIGTSTIYSPHRGEYRY